MLEYVIIPAILFFLSYGVHWSSPPCTPLRHRLSDSQGQNDHGTEDPEGVFEVHTDGVAISCALGSIFDTVRLSAFLDLAYQCRPKH